MGIEPFISTTVTGSQCVVEIAKLHTDIRLRQVSDEELFHPVLSLRGISLIKGIQEALGEPVAGNIASPDHQSLSFFK
jgi:hypothetical protein